MIYHGSKTPYIKKLIPRKSLHGEEYVYLTTNIAVALIYTVNAIESYYDSMGIAKPTMFQPWYSYGFTKEKVPCVEEYYPNATIETYKGKSGYIYICKEPSNYSNPTNIHCALTTSEKVEVLEEIFIPDVYEKMLEFEKQGILIINRYEDNTKKKNLFIESMIVEDIKKYDLIENKSNDYSVFLRCKFPQLF